MRPLDDDPEAPSRPWWSRLVVWSLQPRVWIAFALAGLFVVVIPVFPVLWPAVRPHARFQMSAGRIELTTSTRWAPHDIVGQVASRHPEWNQRNLLESTLTADISHAFAQHPWIARVEKVEKTRQGRIVVQVVYRHPVAMVETHRGLYPIDSEGILLPPNDFSLTESNRLPHVRNVRSMPNGPAGTQWGDPVVAAGARLCTALMSQSTLDSYWERYGLEAVIAPDLDLSALRNTSDHIGSETPVDHPVPMKFELLTAGGRRVIWGRAPGDDSLEPTVEQKFLRLDSYLRQHGSLDNPPDTIAIDIRGFDSIRRITSRHPEREAPR